MEESSQGTSMKKEKGRVRFNHDADDNRSRVEESASAQRAEDRGLSPIRSRPSVSRGHSYNSALDMDDDDKASSAAAAQQRAQRAQQVAAAMLGHQSLPQLRISSRRNSVDYDSDADSDKTESGNVIEMADLDGIPKDIETRDHAADNGEQVAKRHQHSYSEEAYNLVRAHTQQGELHFTGIKGVPDAGPSASPSAGPSADQQIQKPPHYGGVFAEILKLYKLNSTAAFQKKADISGYSTPGSYATTPSPSGATTPTRRKWYEDRNRSQHEVTQDNLAEVSNLLRSPGNKSPKRPKYPRSPSSKFLSKLGKWRTEEEHRITIHIADILKRHEYIVKLCRALMLFGAPTHRLEEYLSMTSKALEVDSQFLYLPGCMIISFDDHTTHTTEVKIVRSSQGVNLGKLEDIHEIYKEVLHDVCSLDEGTVRLDEILEAKDKFHPWLRVIACGFASATVGPFAFNGQFLDMPIAFLLGCLLGFLQIIVAPKSSLYSNVFEISATVLTSFLARAVGSIRDGDLFCFSSIAQSSIALILPGYFVLCSSLELQSRAIVPGSIRMVYAIIYSLFLGYGMTIGILVYECRNPLPSTWLNFLFVFLFSLCLALVNQAKWKQMPVMTIIAMAGYAVSFFSSMKFPAGELTAPISNMLGALTVGVLANLHSRLQHGVAAAVMLPAIFVQVPSGLAATGSLVSGLSTANHLNNSTMPVNGTTTVPFNQTTADNSGSMNALVFNVAASMIQIAIGITVGLFLAALLVYPFGKRRSGLFSF